MFSNHNLFMEEFNCRGKLSSLTLESVRPDPELPRHNEEQRLFVAKLFYDQSGLLIRKQEPRKLTFYHYNGNNDLEKEVELRESEKISREKTYQYSAGRLLSEISGNEKITYHYNSRDKLSYTTNWTGDIQETVCSYGFDEQGQMILKEIRDMEGQLLRSRRIKRNLQGLIAEEILINQENIILEHNRYEYSVFHGENWLKRETFRLEENREPALTEILYRNITLAPESLPAQTPPADASSTPGEGVSSSSRTDTSSSPLDSAKPPTEIQVPETPESAIPSSEADHSERETAGERSVKELLFKNGRYKGSVNSQNHPDGPGEFWGKDGNHYSGEFSDGEMNGRGNLLHKNGSSYTGDFLNGLPHGTGECLWPDGSRYRGEFIKGEMHGLGSFTWSDGTRFTGLFEHNKSTDQGLLENADLSEETDSQKDNK